MASIGRFALSRVKATLPLVTRLAILALVLGVAFGGARAFNADAAGPRRTDVKYPTILVHGWWSWPEMAEANLVILQTRLMLAGYPAVVAEIPAGNDNYAIAEYLADFVEQTKQKYGVDKVNILGESMGGVSVRQYIKNLGGSANVDNYIALGTSQKGVWNTCIISPIVPQYCGVTCDQMCPVNKFMLDLNKGADVPTPTKSNIIWSTDDDDFDYTVDGKACYIPVTGSHIQEASSTAVADKVIQILSGKCPGYYMTLPIR